MSYLDAAIKRLEQLIARRLDAAAPFRAIVDSIDGDTGMVAIQRLDATTPETELRARVGLDPLAVGDEVLCLPVSGAPVIVGKVHRAAPPSVPTGSIAEVWDIDALVEENVWRLAFRQGLGVFGGEDDGIADVFVNLPNVQGNHWNNNTNRTINGAGTTTLASGTLPLADGVTYKCFAIGYFEGYSESGPSGVTITINLGSASSTSETLIAEGGVNAPKLRFATTSIVGAGSNVTFSIDVTWVSGDTRIESAQLAALAIPLTPQ